MARFGVMQFSTLVIMGLIGGTSAPAGAVPGVLSNVLENVKTAYTKQDRPIVIFDLDGALFDSRPRVQQILKEYATEELKGVRPEMAQKLTALTTSQIQYVLADTLRKAGIGEDAVVNNATVFWSPRFFSDDYLRYDVPVSGAVSFVRTAYSAGARIVYVANRDAPRHLLGTVRALRDHGYPIGIQGTELILKPAIQLQDALFTQQTLNYLRHFGRVIAAFDTDPGRANVYRRAFADASVILLTSQHAADAPPLLAKVDVISAFE